MIYITLHNLHTWGKSHMTKAGDICVAASLAEQLPDKTVYVAATQKQDLNEVQELYRDVKFEKFDTRDIKTDDVIVIPILEISRIPDDNRDDLIQFYSDVLSTRAKIFVMNIHHNKEFYRKTLGSCQDRLVANLASKILESCIYLTHDECMNLNQRYNSHCIEQIVFFDQSKFKDVNFYKNRDLLLTFYRPSSFKGFNLWLEEVKRSRSNKHVAVCNTKVNAKYDELVKKYESDGIITVYETIHEYLSHPCENSALISAPYSIESDDFQELIRRSRYCLNTTDYNVLAELNDGEKPDYLVLENAMFDASLHGLALRWSPGSLATMPKLLSHKCILLCFLSAEQQRQYFSEVYNAERYLKEISRLKEIYD